MVTSIVEEAFMVGVDVEVVIDAVSIEVVAVVVAVITGSETTAAATFSFCRSCFN